MIQWETKMLSEGKNKLVSKKLLKKFTASLNSGKNLSQKMNKAKKVKKERSLLLAAKRLENRRKTLKLAQEKKKQINLRKKIEAAKIKLLALKNLDKETPKKVKSKSKSVKLIDDTQKQESEI